MEYRLNIKDANIHIPNTKSILFGPAGLTGTEAPLIRVKAGVRSCIFAAAA